MYKLGLEKAEESEIKLPTFAESQRKQDNSRKTSASLTMWKILQEMGIPDHLTCLPRNLYAGQEETVRTGHGTTEWFIIGKGIHVCCHLVYLTYTQIISHEMLGWINHKLGSRWLGEVSITSDTQMIPLQWQKVKRN